MKEKNHLSIGVLTLHLYLPEIRSLKEKRSLIKPLLAKLHRIYNVSAAEIDFHDSWKESLIACVVVSNRTVFTQQVLQKIQEDLEAPQAGFYLIDQNIQLL